MMSKALETVLPVLEDPQYFELDHDRIDEVAAIMAPHVKKIDRGWNWSPHNIEDLAEKWPLLVVQNIVNFRGWKMLKGEKRTFTIEYDDKPHYGAGAVMACIKRAYDEGKPILEPSYLKKLSVVDANKIFRGRREIKKPDGSKEYRRMIVPALLDRVHFLKNLGKVVEKKGGFHELVELSNGYAFSDEGTGLVQLLAEADGYDDRTYHGPSQSWFDLKKKDQLAVIMGFESKSIPKIKDVKNLSVAADYLLPALGIYTGMMRVKDQKLVEILQNSKLIEPDSLIEQEMRAFTVIMGAELAKRIRSRGVRCNEYMVDYPMFRQVRRKCRKVETDEPVCETECDYSSVCAIMSDPELKKVRLPRVKGNFY